MMNHSTSAQSNATSFCKLPLLSLVAALFFLTPFKCRAQSDIKTPHTGELPCTQILRLQQSGVIRLYERKYGEGETKWAMADYNRCRYNANYKNARRLSPAAQESISTLRKNLEDYFSASYSMMTIEVGGGKPFELDELDSQSTIEDLISKAIIIYSKPLVPRPELRARANNNLNKLENKLPEITAPLKAEAIFNNANTEEGREEIRDREQRHKEAREKLSLSFQNLRTLISALPDSIALLTSEVVKPKN